jgi:hypothetical protein
VKKTPSNSIVKFIGGVNSALPTLSLIGTIAMAVVMYLWSQQTSSVISAQRLNNLETNQNVFRQEIDTRRIERDKQIDELKKNILTNAVFEEFRSHNEKRMDRFENKIDRLLENQK